MRFLKSLAVAALLFASPALAQTGTVTNHAFAIGAGPGVTGYTSLLCTSAQLAVGQAAADPICQTITGDVTLSAGGVTAIGATKVTSAMLNADVFSTAHSWSGQQTFTAPILGTPASGTLTNATGLPISTGVSGLGTGCATFLGTPSSANLRGCLTDEVGTGAAYFVGGALGTPASATLTNATGLPVGGIASIGANTVVANATGSSASPTAFSMPSCSLSSSALIWTSGTGFGCNTISVGGGTNIQTASYTITTSDCGKTVAESGTLQTITLPAVTGFSEGCAITIVNTNSSRGQKLSGFPNSGQGCSLGQGILWPAGSCDVQVVNGAWTTTRPQRRWKTPSALTVYTNSGGSNSNDCLATGTANACASLNRAAYMACNEFDFTGLESGQTVLTIQLDTNDTGGLHYSCRTQEGSQGGAPIVIQGSSSTIVLSGTSTDAIGVFVNAIVQVRQITLASTTAGSCITADLHAQVYVLDQVTLNACASAHFNASNNSEIYLNNSYAVFGSAPFHFLAQNGGHITTQGTVVATLGTNITVTTWVTAGQQGGVIVPNWSVNLNSFTVTGQRFNASNLGLIYIGTGNCTTSFPGSTAGSVTNGAQCL